MPPCSSSPSAALACALGTGARLSLSLTAAGGRVKGFAAAHTELWRFWGATGESSAFGLGWSKGGGPVGWELRVLPAASGSEDNSAVGSLLVVWLGEKLGQPQMRGSAAPALALGTVRALWLNRGAQPDAAVAQNQPGAEFPRTRELGF